MRRDPVTGEAVHRQGRVDEPVGQTLLQKGVQVSAGPLLSAPDAPTTPGRTVAPRVTQSGVSVKPESKGDWRKYNIEQAKQRLFNPAPEEGSRSLITVDRERVRLAADIEDGKARINDLQSRIMVGLSDEETKEFEVLKAAMPQWEKEKALASALYGQMERIAAKTLGMSQKDIETALVDANLRARMDDQVASADQE